MCIGEERDGLLWTWGVWQGTPELALGPTTSQPGAGEGYPSRVKVINAVMSDRVRPRMPASRSKRGPGRVQWASRIDADWDRLGVQPKPGDAQMTKVVW